MSLALLFLYLMLNMFRMLIHPSSGACDLFVELFHGLYWSGSVCVGLMLWFGCSGVVSVCRPKHYWPVHVECGGWELMNVWNRGLVFPGLCSGMRQTHSGAEPRRKQPPVPNNHSPFDMNRPVVLQPAYGYHIITAIPQPNTNTHRTRPIQPLKWLNT